MDENETKKTENEKEAKPHHGWLFFSKSITSGKHADVGLTILALLMAVVILSIVVLAALGKLPNLGEISSSLAGSSSLT
jgi:hypothetical protein